jgi:two-component system, NtrC family, nitrogen regulation sensor histidine kinase NtrY
MFFSKDRRRRAVFLLSCGVVLFFALLGALQWFNTSGVRFLNPETSGETLAFTGLTVVLFLLLIVLLLLLLRNILKLYADQGSSALGARLRTRMVLGAALIALTPAVLMFLFSFQLMNRSIDRWFSPNTSELREDSNRVVRELAQYVANNARVEAESISASGAPDLAPPQLKESLGSYSRRHAEELLDRQATADKASESIVTVFTMQQPPADLLISITPGVRKLIEVASTLR